MRRDPWRRAALAACTVFTLAILLAVPAVAAEAALEIDTQELVQRYAPVLYFHPDEIFRPQSVDVLLNTARVRHVRDPLPDTTVLARASLQDLPTFQDVSYYLDVWLGDKGSSDARNYTALRDHYLAALSPLVGGPPIVTYAHVGAGESRGHITIQYWFFYFYNDWFNKHEGDWEMIQVMLDRTGQPEWAVYSQHQGGTRRPWQDVPVEDGTHPIVYVSQGSHANYFWGGEMFPHGRYVGNTQVEVLDRTGRQSRIMPEVIALPEAGAGTWIRSLPRSLAWLGFAGRWGESTELPDFSGPLGPSFKGEQWNRPYAWGMRQPLDLEVWYRNRLRVSVTGAAAQVALISSQRSNTPAVETLAGVTLLHDDPLPGEVFTARIEASQDRRFDLVAVIPAPDIGQVSRYLFRNVTTAAVGCAYLAMRVGDVPVLFIEGASPRWPNTLETEDALWDAPDFVWMAQGTTAVELVLGLGISFLVGIIPAYIYLGLLYYADRYEKEPPRLILTAFFAGAWPAFLIGLSAVLVFRLPIELWGRDAVEAIRVGLLAPVIEELAKGAVVLFIIYRFRREVDSVLDGVIYGAAVGLGFAMTANMLSYMGAFATHGFVELQQKIFVEGFLHGLDHAFYTALFGAGLAYATFARSRTRRWAVPLGALLLAMAANGLHDLTLRNSVGFNPLAVGLTWMGAVVVFTIMFWSLRRQHLCIRCELAGEVPDRLRRTLLRPDARALVEAQALKQGGWRAWRRTRLLFDLCARLALRKAQSSAHPGEPELAAEVESLRTQIRGLLAATSMPVT